MRNFGRRIRVSQNQNGKLSRSKLKNSRAAYTEVWEGMSEDTLTKTKFMLYDMHKRKIDMADEIFVINVGGYIGSSTKSKIEYAHITGKAVRYMEKI